MTPALLALSFDNLGEAAEIELGGLVPDAPEVGSHPTATRVVPRLLELLDESGVVATFFVEGLNTELYPDLLRRIASAGHEVAFHAWRHEEWGSLAPEVQAANLERGLAGFERLGIEVAGMRPPGGRLGAGGVGVLADAGLRYCSPEGELAGREGEVAVLPFQWRHVDVVSVLPDKAAERERMTGSPDPLGPEAFVDHLGAEVDRLAAAGEGFLTPIFHPFMLEWLGEERLIELLDRVDPASRGGSLEVCTLGAAAESRPTV